MCCLALGTIWAAGNGVFEGFNPLTRPRQERERVSCLGNLRALSLAMMQYQDDHGDHYPPAQSRVRASPYGWADTLLPYFKDPLKLRCPGDETPRSTSSAQSGYTSYWINSNLSGRSGASLTPGPRTLLGEGGDGRDITDARYSKASLPAWVDEEAGPSVRHAKGTKREACYLWTSGITKSLTPREAHRYFGPTFKVR